MKTGKRQVLIMTAFSAIRCESATTAEPSDLSNWSQGLLRGDRRRDDLYTHVCAAPDDYAVALPSLTKTENRAAPNGRSL